MLSARQKLSQSLSFRLNERKIPTSYVASRCRVLATDVLRWLDGSLVPNSGEWTDLNKFILRNAVPDSLWQDAKAEQDEEHRRTLRALDKASPPTNDRPGTVVTNLGDKLRQVGITEPPKVPEQAAPVMNRTRPNYRKSTREERRRFR